MRLQLWAARAYGWAPAMALMGLIFYMSSNPAPELFRRNWFDFQDKAIHCAVYYALSAFMLRAFLWQESLSSKMILWSALIAGLYGASDELHQSFVPSRTAGVDDLIADIVGAALVYPTQGWLRRVWEFEKNICRRLFLEESSESSSC